MQQQHLTGLQAQLQEALGQQAAASASLDKCKHQLGQCNRSAGSCYHVTTGKAPICSMDQFAHHFMRHGHKTVSAHNARDLGTRTAMHMLQS